MCQSEKRYRVQYWGKAREGKPMNHAAKQYPDHTTALLSYIRNVQDAALGMINVQRIRLEELQETGWVALYECNIFFRGSGTPIERAPRRDYLIKQWRKENPQGSKAECIKATGLDKKSVKRWWD